MKKEHSQVKFLNINNSLLSKALPPSPQPPLDSRCVNSAFELLHMPSAQERRRQATHASTLAWKTHGRRSLAGCSPSGRYESDTTEWLHFHFSLSCIGEVGNGNPLQRSCLENPRDGGAWWAAVYGVAQGWIWLKWLSKQASAQYGKLSTGSFGGNIHFKNEV